MTINHPLVKGKVRMLKPFIYCVEIKDDYDRAMLFCRYQEFYESPYKSIRGKYFSWETFMRTYTKERGAESFTYPYDWSGYNIPSNVLEKGIDTFYKQSEYDKIMNDIFFYCAIDSQIQNNGARHKWYLIGADFAESQTMKHEIAHGLYFTNKKYKKSMDTIISEMKKSDFNFMKKSLIKMGYADDSKIIADEIQAFMSTGLYTTFDNENTRSYQDIFQKVYLEFNI
jgi:hypothetical protein